MAAKSKRRRRAAFTVEVSPDTDEYTVREPGGLVTDRAYIDTLPKPMRKAALEALKASGGVTVDFGTVDELLKSRIPATSKATSDNPKNIFAKARVDTTLVSAIAILHAADAMTDGADKYEPYNWRAKKVAVRAYIAACKRHLDAWMEGEETASDSGCHHLGHAIATLTILLDAQAHGCIIDDRLNKDGGQAFNLTRAQVEKNISQRRAKRQKETRGKVE